MGRVYRANGERASQVGPGRDRTWLEVSLLRPSFWNTNLERILGHVSCDRALCKAIDPCSAAKVPEEQRLEAKAQLDARNGVAPGKKKRAAQADETAEDDATHRASHQAMLRNKQESKCKVDSALSGMFDGLGIAHSKADHPLVKRFVESVKNSPSDWKLPSSKTFGGNLLDSEHKVNLDERNESCSGTTAYESLE